MQSLRAEVRDAPLQRKETPLQVPDVRQNTVGLRVVCTGEGGAAMSLDEIRHIFENSTLVSDHFTLEAVTAAYVEALAALHARREAKANGRQIGE